MCSLNKKNLHILFSNICCYILGIDPEIQMNCAFPLVKEILQFLNTLPRGELEIAVLNSVKSWFNLNAQSPLLLPCLKVSTHFLSVSHMVLLSECCISSRFSSGKFSFIIIFF